MPTVVNIAPLTCEIREGDLPDGHFWGLKFVDQETGDVANIVFNDSAFFDFAKQIAGFRATLRN